MILNSNRFAFTGRLWGQNFKVAYGNGVALPNMLHQCDSNLALERGFIIDKSLGLVFSGQISISYSGRDNKHTFFQSRGSSTVRASTDDQSSTLSHEEMFYKQMIALLKANQKMETASTQVKL